MSIDQTQSFSLGSAASSELRIDGLHPLSMALPATATSVLGFNSRDERSRPFNLLRGQIQRLAQKRDLRIIGITSATPRVGKSFIAVNLAASLARLPELKTYLFDFDLRRSSIADYFQIPAETGLTEFLDGRSPDLETCAWMIEDQNLTVFPSYRQKVLSSELVSGARMDALIGAMRQAIGPAICICDLPPVFANDDAVIISQKIDGYILVIEDGVSTAKQVKHAMRLLEPAQCLGTVLNRYDGGMVSDDYGYGYGSRGQYSDYFS